MYGIIALRMFRRTQKYMSKVPINILGKLGKSGKNGHMGQKLVSFGSSYRVDSEYMYFIKIGQGGHVGQKVGKWNQDGYRSTPHTE